MSLQEMIGTSGIAGAALMFQALATAQVTAAESNKTNISPFYSATGGASAGPAAAVATKHQPPPFAQPAGPRYVLREDFVNSEPLFVREARTLDPVDIVRVAWKGYVTQRADPWGLAPDLKPTLRYSFNCRALPWPSIKHDPCDGLDNNGRGVGAWARLHALFGKELESDPVEAGTMAYLAYCSNPEQGCGGEVANNLILLYQYTGRKQWRDWAEIGLNWMRRHTPVTNRPGIGPVAVRNMFSGWEIIAFSRWYELTGEKSALEFATAEANRDSISEDANDGAFRPDGSFGVTNQAINILGPHMHAHTHSLKGLLHLGGQLIKAGDQKTGLRMIHQANATFDWLYDPSRNPDAGSMTGWLGEWLIVQLGWNREADCEGCSMGDVVQAATMLGAASRMDASFAQYANYYDRAEQIFRGQLVEQMFQLKPRYLALVKECLQKRVDKQMTNAAPELKAQALEQRYAEAVKTAERMVGQQLGACGFPDWVNKLQSDLDSDLPGIHMQGCCADATIRGAYAIWAETVTGNDGEARVNMAFNRKSDLVDVVSCLPYRGEVDLAVHKARRVLVRVPEWTSKSEVKVYVNRVPVATKWDGAYVVFPKTKSGELLTVTYPLRTATIKETVGSLAGIEYTERWRGNTIVHIEPPGKWIPMFERPELESETVP